MRLIDADIKVSDYIETWQCKCSENGTQTVMAVEDLQYLPTIDPVRAAGGCYCRECKFAKPSTYTGYLLCTGYNNPNYVVPNGGCLEGEPKEAKDDG